MSQAKCVICPSFYDSFPNVITEANLCGCNVVISKNVGQSYLLNAQFVVNDFYDKDEWIDKIMLATKKKIPGYHIDQVDILKQFDEIIKA